MSKKKKINIYCDRPTWLPCRKTSVPRLVRSIQFFPVVVDMYSWSSLFIWIHLVPKICDPPNQYLQPFQGHLRTCAKRRKLESPNTHCPSIYWTKQTAFLFQFSYYKQVSLLAVLLSATFSPLCFLLVILLLKMTHRCSTEMSSSVSKCKKAVTCILKKTCFK